MHTTIASIIAFLIISVAGCGSDKVPVSSSFRNISSAIPPLKTYGNYGALWGDFNNDERVDLIFMGHGAGPLTLAQNVDNTFADVTSRSGIKNSGWVYSQQNDRHGASCTDFDNDGNLDLYISHGAQEGETLGIKFDELLKGNGNFTFSDITHSAGTLNQFGRGRSGVWFDYNNDGWLDLYVTNYLSNNVMYKNNGDSTFTDVTVETGLGFSGAHAAPADFDQDGHIDLLVAWPLRLLRNDNSGRFEELSKSEFKYKDMFAYGIAWGDPDNDGDLDIFFSGLGNEGMLLVNDYGSFRDLEGNAWKLNSDSISTGVSWGDMNNDGLLDLVNIRSDGYFIYQNEGGLSFSVVRLDAPAPAITYEKSGDAALADFDNNGLLDIATDDSNRYMLLRNETVTSNHWLKLQFQGKTNNRLGIGNKIWITSEGKLLAYREYTGTHGSLRAASCNELHIGLAQNSEVDIRVQWLNGHLSVLENVSTDQLLTVSDFQSEELL
jgi:enediyne biosynthesis protein E4